MADRTSRNGRTRTARTNAILGAAAWVALLAASGAGLSGAGPVHALALPPRSAATPLAGGFGLSPTDLFVSPAGNDSGPCGVATPCRQIATALDRAGPSATVVVADGSYLPFSVQNHGGGSNATLRIVAPGGGAWILAPLGGSTDPYAIELLGSSRVFLSGLNGRGAPGAEVLIAQCDHVTLANGRFESAGQSAIVIRGTHDARLTGDRIEGTLLGPGLRIGAGARDVSVLDSVFAGNRHVAALVGPGQAGGSTPAVRSVEFARDIFFGNGADGGDALELDGVAGGRVVNDLFYNNSGGGLLLAAASTGSSTHPVLVADDTVLSPAPGGWPITVRGDARTLVLRDDLWASGDPARSGPHFATAPLAAAANSDYNLFSVLGIGNETPIPLALWRSSGHDVHSVSASPASLFVNGSARDLELAASAVARGAGVGLAGVDQDLRGNLRPTAGPTDIGCYESPGAAPGGLSTAVWASATSGAAPFTVTLEAVTSGGSPPYWDQFFFGDGQDAVGAGASHTYLVPGNYSVTLVTTDRAGAVAHGTLLLTVTGPTPGSNTSSVRFVPDGLPAGVSWALTWSGHLVTGEGPLFITGLTPGAYTVAPQPAFSSAPLESYWPPAQVSFSVPSNATVSVPFAREVYLNVSAGPGGEVTPSGGWVVPGTPVTLTAVPASGFRFVGWFGSGPGSRTGSALALTLFPNDSVNESARFLPLVTGSGQIGGATSSTSALAPWALAGLALALAALLVGFGLAFREARRSLASARSELVLARRPPPPPPPVWSESP